MNTERELLTDLLELTNKIDDKQDEAQIALELLSVETNLDNALNCLYLSQELLRLMLEHPLMNKETFTKQKEVVIKICKIIARL